MKIPLTIVAAFLLQSASAQMDIYVFAGQSNMSGVAPVTGEPAPLNQGRLMMLYGGQWEAAKDPTNATSGGMGPALWAADRLASLTGHTVGIVNVAKAGTYMWQWAPDYSSHSLYGRMMAAAREASQYGTVKGFFWYQGEAETINADMVHVYGSEMHTLFDAIEKDLGVPIVFVQLGPDPHDPRMPYWSAIQTVQGWIAEGAPSFISMVSAKDLQAIPGNPYHLNQASQITLGGRLGDAMYQLLGGQ